MPRIGNESGDPIEPGESTPEEVAGLQATWWQRAKAAGYTGSFNAFQGLWWNAVESSGGNAASNQIGQLVLQDLNITSGSAGDDGSGGSGGSGSGSGGGSTYDAAAARASFIQLLRAWGMRVGQSKDLANLVDQAVKKKFTTAEFVTAAQATKIYAEYFPGIDWKNGQSEAEYNADFRGYKKVYDTYFGIGKFTRAEFGSLMKKGMTSEEWGVRVDAMRQLKENKHVFQAFNQYLSIHNKEMLPKNKQGQRRPLNQKELFNLVTGQANRRFEEIWDTARTVGMLESMAGFDVTKKGLGDDVKAKAIHRLLNQYEAKGNDLDALTPEFYQELAGKVSQLVPLSQMKNWGLTKEDVLTVAFQGKNAGALTHKMVQLLQNAKAEEEGSMAAPQLAAKQGGGTQLLGYDTSSAGTE